MVIKPSDYAAPFRDPDVDVINVNLTKKNRIKTMPDVEFAIKTAEEIQKEKGLNLEACTFKGKHREKNDFLFSGKSWLDPEL
jgi:hypothetical protein